MIKLWLGLYSFLVSKPRYMELWRLLETGPMRPNQNRLGQTKQAHSQQ